MSSCKPRGLALALLLVVMLFPGAAAASADSVVVTVVNAAGVPQADTKLYVNSHPDLYASGQFSGTTDGFGNKTLTVWPGDVIQATRAYQPGDPCNAPEQQGVSSVVPNPVPAAITLTVPDANAPTAYQPALSNSEDKFVGLVNQLRAQQQPPLPPVFIATTLVDAASRYVSVVPQSPVANAHCLLSGPLTRDINSGFPVVPGSSGGEIITQGAYSATTAFQVFENSPPHRAIMLLSNVNAIGVAVDGGVWVADFSQVNPSDPYSYRAQLTADAGNPNLPEDNPGSGASAGNGGNGSDGNGLSNPHLQFSRIRVKGQRVQVSLHLAPGAAGQGRVLLLARRHGGKRSLTLNGLQARTKLGRGRWSLQAEFIPRSSEWARATISRQLKILPLGRH